MSQIYKAVTAGNLPPSVPTSFTTQSGSAVPAANILIIDAYDTSENNDNGIETKGGVAGGNPPGTGLANEVDIYLTNRVTGQITTSDSTLTTLISFPLAVNTVYSMSGTVTARSTATGEGASFEFLTSIRRSAGVAIEIGSEYPTEFVDATLATSDIFVIVSGNNMILQCQGVALTTINWDGFFTYRQVI